MSKNSYVTAAIFVVFLMLTVVYFTIPGADTNPGITGTVIPTDESTPQALLASDEVGEEQDGDAEEGTETMDTESTADANLETTSSIQALRAEQERHRTQQAAALTEIIASADHDAETKSAAKDSLNELDRMTHSQRNLESIIRSMGFTDVLVRADEDAVRVTVQVQDIDSAPNREEIAELYVVAGLEFVNHNNIQITVEPLN